jgi:DNA-binding response OmpR family regulator
MRHPQLLILNGDQRLAGLLDPATAEARWRVHRPRDLAECLQILPRGGPSVLVLRLGRDLEAELETLERVRYLFPETATVVVGDSDQDSVAGLAWDLGAAFVLVPPLPREWLVDVVTGLMTDRLDRT